MADVIQLCWHFLCGFVPGGLIPYLVLLAIVLYVITSIFRHSGIMSRQRYRSLVVGSLLLFMIGYMALWLLTLPQRKTALIVCLPTQTVTPEYELDAEQRLLPLNIQLAFPPSGGDIHWQDCIYLAQFADPDSLRDLERVCRLLNADFVIQPLVDSTGVVLRLHRYRWQLTRLIGEVPVCACDPLEAAELVRAALLDKLKLPLPSAADSWYPEDLELIFVSDTLGAIAQLQQRAAGIPLLQQQLARLLLLTDRTTQSRNIASLLQELAAVDSAALPLQLLYARWYAGSEEWDAVEQALANALTLDPFAAEARYLAAHLLPDRRQRLGYGEAGELLQQLRLSEPAWQPGRLAWISWLEQHGHLQEALQEAQELAFLLPQSYHASFRMALMAFRTQHYQLAGETYRRLTSEYPDKPDPFYNPGINCFMIRDYPAGLNAFKRVLELGGDHNAHLYLAKCYAWLGNRELAIYHLRQRLLFRGDADQVQIDEAVKELSLYFPERHQQSIEEE